MYIVKKMSIYRKLIIFEIFLSKLHIKARFKNKDTKIISETTGNSNNENQIPSALIILQKLYVLGCTFFAPNDLEANRRKHLLQCYFFPPDVLSVLSGSLMTSHLCLS